MTDPAAGPAEPGDPGVLGWALTVALWAELVIALTAALAGSRGFLEAGLFAGYAALLCVVAAARSGLYPWTRWPTVGALFLALALHLLPWAVPLGRQPPRLLEAVVYVLLLGVGLVAVQQERRAAPAPLAPLSPVLRAVEVASRSLGLLFLAGLILLLLDAVVRLPFSGH